MYYYFYNTKRRKTYHKAVTVLFFFSISLFTFHSIVFAGTLAQPAEEYRAKGYEEQQKGHFDAALTYYTKAVTLGEENAVVFNDIGIVYEHLGNPARAEKFYLKAIQVNQDYLPPYTNLAYLYKEKGDTRKAVTFFQERLKRAVEGDPWKDRIKEALGEINPNFKKTFLAQKARALEKELLVQARKKVREEFNLQIIRSQKHFKRGQQYAAEKKFNEAIREFDRALILTPDNPLIIKALEEALYEKEIEDIKTRTGKAVEKLNSGEIESAKKEFQRILATIPNESIQESKQ